MNVLGTGLSGLVGSRLTALLSPKLAFSDISKETGADITDYASLAGRFAADPSEWVFHFAAYTDVQGAEKERELGDKSISWKVNVTATEYVVALAKKHHKRVIYLSTDYVFDGLKTTPYAEDDQPAPKGWYAITKYEGEKRVLGLGDRATVIRISNPYRSFPVGKTDWVHKIVERLATGQPVSSPVDAVFSPTFIDDLAAVIDGVMATGASGICHAGSGIPLSPYDAAGAIATVYGFDPARVGKTTYAEFYVNRAHVPKNGALAHSKTDALGVVLHTFTDGIAAVRQQELEVPADAGAKGAA